MQALPSSICPGWNGGFGKETVELPVYIPGNSGPFLFPEEKEIFLRRILQVGFSMQPQLRQKRIRYRNDTCDVIFSMKYADLPRLKIYIPKFQFLCLCFPQATAVIQKLQRKSWNFFS